MILSEQARQDPQNDERGGVEQFIRLVSRAYLNKKILRQNLMPRVLTVLRDRFGDILVKKYDKLTEPVWRKLCAHTDAPEVYFISERPIRVVEDYNMEFFTPAEFQFLGAYLADIGRIKSAEWLLGESLKSGQVDAYINYGVFHYKMDNQELYDNFQLARRHLDTAIALMNKVDLPPRDEEIRRTICEEALDELDYKTARGLKRLILALARWLRFGAKPNIHYVGAAVLQDVKVEEAIQKIRQTVVVKELEQFKEASRLFVLELIIPPEMSHLSQSVESVAVQIQAAQTEDEVAAYSRVLGVLSVQLTTVLSTVHAAVAEKKVDEAEAPPADVMSAISPEVRARMCRAGESLQMRSVPELVDLARKRDTELHVLYWLYDAHRSERRFLEALFTNPSLPPALREQISREI